MLAIALSLLAPTASAEIRLINGTGQPLVVDVLHADKQERDIQLPVGKGISKTYGAPLEKSKTEMLVVRDAAGKELFREAVQTDYIYAINNWGSDRIIFNQVGRFQGQSSDSTGLQLVNTTGKTITYKTELADFSLREGKGREARDAHHVWRDQVQNVGKEGETRKVTLSVVGTEPLTTEMKVGTLYLLGRDGEALKLDVLH